MTVKHLKGKNSIRHSINITRQCTIIIGIFKLNCLFFLYAQINKPISITINRTQYKNQ
jgi:hypothetical protein